MNKNYAKLGANVITKNELLPLMVAGTGLGVSATGLVYAIRRNDTKGQLIFGTATVGFTLMAAVSMNSIQSEVGQVSAMIADSVQEATHDHDLRILKDSITLLQELGGIPKT